MTDQPTIGYIGLGIMGKAMARNILKAGFPLVVHNRSREAVAELVAEGAKEANSPKEVAEQVEIVFTNLPDSPDVEMVALGADGVIEGTHEGLIFVDNSTIKPATARKIAEKLGVVGVQCLDAPVSGGDIGAQQGTLTIMVGGPAGALEKVMPVFKAVGKTITHIGEAGAGQVAKCANQIMVAVHLAAMGVAGEIERHARGGGLGHHLGRVDQRDLEPGRGVAKRHRSLIGVVVVDVVEADHVDPVVAAAERHGLVGEHGHAEALERLDHVDGVMVAENAVDAVARAD
ncbi:MAG: NAD(P)-binding domain-containing protein, partial [Chloroflexi bacterium]|nr:NAD(P)-binding domain-containing protein [Chloroflexota bacterium]